MSQSAFVITYGTSDVEGGRCIVKGPDGNFIIGGYKQDSSLLMRVDPAGNLLSQYTFHNLASPEGVVHMFVDRDSNLVGVGQSRTDFLPYAFKFDLNNNSMVWIKISTIPGELFHIIEVPGQSDYFLAGTNKYNVAPGGSGDAHLLRLDRNTGNVTTLNRNYNLGGVEAFQHLLYLNDTLYAVGRLSQSGMRDAVTAMDLNGNVHYCRMYFVDPADNARMYHGALVADGDSILLGSNGNSSGTTLGYNIHMTKISRSGLNSWAKEYNVAGYPEARVQHLEKVQGGYLAAGYTGTSGPDQNFLLFKLDQTGNVVWAKRYGDTGNETMGRSAVMLIDGASVYFTGISEVPGNQRDVILIKTNINGDLGEKCTYGQEQVITSVDYANVYNGLQTMNSYVRSFSWSNPVLFTPAGTMPYQHVCYSDTVVVGLDPGSPTEPGLNIASGMATGTISVRYRVQEYGRYDLEVFSMNGQLAGGFQVDLDAGEGQLDLPLSLAQGMYFAKLQASDSQQKIVTRFAVF